MFRICIIHQYLRFFYCEFFNNKEHQNIKFKAKLERVILKFFFLLFL